MHLDAPIDALIRKIRTKKILKLLPKNTPYTLCDLGCGINPFFLKAAAKQGATKVVGIDRLTTTINSEQFEFHNSDLEAAHLPLENCTFDIVSMLAVMEHISQPINILNEAHRILRQGGKLLITTPSRLSKPFLTILAKLRIISQQEIADHKHYFTTKDLKMLLEQAGFANINIKTKDLGLSKLSSAEKP